nr:serrate RNA effector molecule-like [Setaria viridis]
MTYKQFTQVLEDDVSPSQAGGRYQEYRTEYITTQKRAYFDLNKNEDWLKDMYHPTKLLSVIERRNDFCKTAAKNLIHDLQNGTLDLGPGLTADAVIKSGDGDGGSSEDDTDYGEKKRKHGRGPQKEIEPLSVSAAPKAHPVSSQYRRIHTDIDRTLALVKKLDSEKDILGNILLTGDHDNSNVDQSHIRSMGPVVIVRGLNTVKGLEGVELLDTLLTYLWRVHGVDYYGMSEMKYAKGFRHVRAENKSGTMAENNNAADWEKKLDSFWEQRLVNGEDPLVVLTAKDKIDAAIVEVLEPYVRKMRDEKYVWKYGCGAKGCEKLFHAPEYVHKHLRLKHPLLVSILSSRIENDIYFQNYMNDPDAPGGKPVMQQTLQDRTRRRPDEQMFGASGGRGSDAPLLPDPKCALSPVLIPVPGAGPYGPFVPAPPEMAMQMMQKGHSGPDAARHGKPSVLGPTLPMYPSFPLGRRTYRSYEDLDAPKEEIAAIDSRRL